MFTIYSYSRAIPLYNNLDFDLWICRDHSRYIVILKILLCFFFFGIVQINRLWFWLFEILPLRINLLSTSKNLLFDIHQDVVADASYSTKLSVLWRNSFIPITHCLNLLWICLKTISDKLSLERSSDSFNIAWLLRLLINPELFLPQRPYVEWALGNLWRSISNYSLFAQGFHY